VPRSSSKANHEDQAEWGFLPPSVIIELLESEAITLPFGLSRAKRMTLLSYARCCRAEYHMRGSGCEGRCAGMRAGTRRHLLPAPVKANDAPSAGSSSSSYSASLNRCAGRGDDPPVRARREDRSTAQLMNRSGADLRGGPWLGLVFWLYVVGRRIEVDIDICVNDRDGARVPRLDVHNVDVVLLGVVEDPNGCALQAHAVDQPVAEEGRQHKARESYARES
jgi:hypothetical protein